MPETILIDLGEEETEFLHRLKALPPGKLIDPWHATSTTHYDDWAVFMMAAALLMRGEPVYFTCCEGKWMSFGHSEGVGYGYGRTPEDLDGVRHMIIEHRSWLEQLLKGLNRAQSLLAGRN